MSRYASVTSINSDGSTYPFGVTITATNDGLRSNEPGKVLALPNGGEHRVGPPDHLVFCNTTLSPYGYGYGYGSYDPVPSRASSEDSDHDRSRRLPGPVVEDSPGCNLRPDPMVEATDAASLIRALNDFRAWAGDVSYRDMERGCKRLRSSSALQRVLTGTKMPTQAEVKAVILGCGGTEEDVSRYVSAWRHIRSPDRVPAQLVSVTTGKKAS
jgi:hypothetical protein